MHLLFHCDPQFFEINILQLFTAKFINYRMTVTRRLGDCNFIDRLFCSDEINVGPQYHSRENKEIPSWGKWTGTSITYCLVHQSHCCLFPAEIFLSRRYSPRWSLSKNGFYMISSDYNVLHNFHTKTFMPGLRRAFMTSLKSWLLFDLIIKYNYFKFLINFRLSQWCLLLLFLTCPPVPDSRSEREVGKL